jgi:hypothetical protein
MNTSASINFSSLSLHDAILKGLRLDWAARTCIVEVEAFVVRDQNAQPHEMIFQKVCAVTLPHEDPWGPSVFINAVRQEDEVYIIQMQSGDEIRITAGAFYFI